MKCDGKIIRFFLTGNAVCLFVGENDESDCRQHIDRLLNTMDETVSRSKTENPLEIFVIISANT